MKRGFLFLLLIPTLLHTQEVCGFFNNSVIIENGWGVGNVGEERWVIRESSSGIRPVGKVKIKELFEDMVIAQVVDQEPGQRIVIGDQVACGDDLVSSVLIRENSSRRVYSSNQIYPDLYRHSSVSFRRLRIGLSLGALLPYQTLYQPANYSYQAGAIMQYGFNPRSSILFDLMYSFMDERIRSNELPELNNQSVLNINALLRQGLYRAIFMDFGAGIYVPRISVSATTDQRKVDNLEYHYGVCAGLAIHCIQSNSISMFINPRYHTYLMNDKLIENVSVGMNFIL